MKGKKLIWGLLPLSAAMILAACNNEVPTPSDSKEPTSSEVTPTTPSSEDPTPTPTPSSEEPREDVTHRAGLNKTLAEGAITRDYDERFDKVVEDFSGETILGETTGEKHEGYLRVVIDSNLDSFPVDTDPNKAFFKMASSAFDGDKTLLGQGAIHLKMRVTEGKLPLKNMVFGVRPGNDNNANVYKINMADALNEDAEKNPELTNEFQDISISLGDTIDDANTTFPGLEEKVLQYALGFHLMVKADANVSAVIEIGEVSFVKGETVTLIDDFKRDDVQGNASTGRVYWGPTDSNDALLVRKGVLLGENKAYTTPTLSDEQKALSHVVIAAQGDMSSSKVSVTFDDEASTVKTLEFKDLKAQGENAVVNVVDGLYSNIAIDLAAFNGPEGAKAKTIKIENTGKKALEISKVFMTSFQVPDLNKRYPAINTSTAVTFDDMNRVYNKGKFPSGGDGYTASSAEEQNIAAGINGLTSWSMADQISMSDGALNMPATEGYAEVSIDSQHVLENADYLVFSIGGEEGYDLNLFRFKMDGKEIWFNAANAMEGVKTYGDETYPSPYVKDGYTWYIVDLHYHDVAAKGSIELYYTGSKNIKIDSIFFANAFSASVDREKDITEIADKDLTDYSWVGNIHIAYKSDLFTFIVKGDGVATFESFRFEYNGGTLWLKDGVLKLLDEKGTPVDPTSLVPEEETRYYIDLTTTGFGATGNDYAHMHIGGGFTGKVTITKIGTARKGVFTQGNAKTEVPLTAAWAYCGGQNPVTVDVKQMYLHISGDGTNNLSQFRVLQLRDGKNVGEVWAKDKALLKDVEGNPIDINAMIGEEGIDVIMDYEGVDLDVKAGDELGFHITGIAEGKLTFEAGKAFAYEYSSKLALDSYNQTLVTPAE